MEYRAYSLDGPSTLVFGGTDGDDGNMISDYLDQELKHLEEVPVTPTVRLLIDPDVGHTPASTFGVSGGISIQGDFVVPDGAGHWCAFDPGALGVSHLSRTLIRICCGQFKANVLLDWILLPVAQFAAAAGGVVPLHASGASLPGMPGPVVFSAWSGVGKTNLVLWALGQGGAYLGDDRVYVHADASASASTRRVSIYGYNRHLARGLDGRQQVSLLVGDTLHRLGRRQRGRLGFLLSYAANGLGSTRVAAAALGGEKGPLARVSVQAHVVCRAAPDLDAPRVVELAQEGPDQVVGFAKAHVAVMEYEFVWFRRFLQTWAWASRSPADPWDELCDKWTTNLADYYLSIPRRLQLDLPVGRSADIAPAAWGEVTRALSA